MSFTDELDQATRLHDWRRQQEAAHGLTPGLLTSVARAESVGRSAAVSPKGAQGMYQFMPATAAQYGIDPYDDFQATTGAARYLADLKRQFGGDETLAVAAYNAGPGAVRRHGGILPYAETQSYVRKVFDGLIRPANAGEAESLDFARQLDAIDAARPEAAMADSQKNGLLSSAIEKYPFIKKHNPVVILTPKDDMGYAETWPIGEEGDSLFKRPSSLPINSLGIQVFKPEKFSLHDIAGEVLHVDSKAKEVREKIKSSLSKDQIDYLKSVPDYVSGENLSDDRRLDNAVDSSIRGYLLGQWPKQEVEKFFNSEQKKSLNGLLNYMTGKDDKEILGNSLNDFAAALDAIDATRQAPASASKSTALEAGLRSAGASVVPTVGGLAGGVVGAETGAGLGALGGPLAPVTVPAGAILGGLVGAVGGGLLGHEFQGEMLGRFAPDFAHELDAQLAQDRAEHPAAALVGELAPNLALMSPSVANVGKALSTAGGVLSSEGRAALAASPDFAAQVGNLANVGAGAGLGLGLEGYNQLQDGQVDLTRLLLATAGGALLNKPNALARRLGLGGGETPEEARAKLDARAQAEGFASSDEFLKSLYDVVETPDGPVVRPKTDVLDDLPGESNPVNSVAVDKSEAEADISASASATAAEREPAALPRPAGGEDPAPEVRQPAWADLVADADERERLGRATQSAAIRQQLFGEALALRKQADALRNGTAPKLTPAERAARLKTIDPEQDSLITAIRKLGGIDVNWESDWEGRLSHLKRQAWGLPPVERKTGGRTLDDLAESLYDLGYLDTRDKRELETKLGLAETGQDLYSVRKDDYSKAFAPRDEMPRSMMSDADATHHDLGEDWAVDADGYLSPVRHGSMAELEREFTILGPDGETRPARPMSERDLIDLLEEERHAEEWFRREEESVRAGSPDSSIGAYAQPESTGGLPDLGKAGSPLWQSYRAEGWADTQSAHGKDPVAAYERNDLSSLTAGATVDPGRPGSGLSAGQPLVHYTQTGTLPSGLARATTPAEIAHIAAGLRKSADENLLAIVTDSAGNLLRVHRVAKGGREAVQLPGLGEMAASVASTPDAEKVWLVHNHPTGDPTQSEVDGALTRAFADYMRGTGIEPQGMVAVAHGSGHFSFYQPGSLDDGQAAKAMLPLARTSAVPVLERVLRGKAGQGVLIDKPAKLKQVAPESGVVLLDAANRAVGFVPLDDSELLKLRRGKGGPSARLLSAIDATNASHLAVRVADAADAEMTAVNVGAFARQGGFRLLDVIDNTGRSLVNERMMPSEGELASATFYANPFGYATAEMARQVGLHPGRNALAGFAGGVAEAIDPNNEERPGSVRWWMRVAMGAFGGIVGMNMLRTVGVVGADSFAAHAMARLGKAVDALPFIGRGPAELREYKRKQDLMRQLMDRQTAEVGKFMLDHFAPSERAQIADLIETRGIVPDLNLVHRQAAELDAYISAAAEKLKALGMLPDDLEVGGYLHRYYAKDLDVVTLLGKPFKQSLSGSYTLARGTNDRFDRQYLSPGAAAHVREWEAVSAEIAALEKQAQKSLRKALRAGFQGGAEEMFPEHYQSLLARRRELEKVELFEFTGGERGKLKSYLFMGDEAGRVPSALRKGAAAIHEDRPGPGLDSRAMPVVEVGQLAPTERRWTLRGADADGVLLHRDWTQAERTAWGEIKDAGYRYVRGMAEVSQDLSLATLFNRVAKNPEWVSPVEKAGWVEVPTANAAGTPLRKYGSLAGQWVRPDVWAGLRNHGRSPLGTSNLAKAYRAALGQWKLWHTADNPVSHFNNTFSNFEMLHLAGYGARDLLAAGQHMRQGEQSALWREAREEGLFGTDWAASILSGETGHKGLLDLAEELRAQPEVADAALVVPLLLRIKQGWIESKAAISEAQGKQQTAMEMARAVVKAGSFFGKAVAKPYGAYARVMRRAYQFEDNLFKLAAYQAERAKGLSPADAVQAANRFFFNYADVPEVVRMVRDLPVGAPFISYTYLALPAMVRNAIERPERLLALVAGYEALNYAAMVGSSDGVQPGQYWALAQAEEENSPEWENGRVMSGARNMVHLPAPEGYRLALGRAHTGGNPFGSEGGGREKLPSMPVVGDAWGSSIFGGSPLHSLLDIAINEDWKGKPVYHPKDPDSEKVRKSLSYLYQAWSPSSPVFPGSYAQSRIVEGLANQAAHERQAGGNGLVPHVVDAANGVAAALGLKLATGLDRAENPILTRDALLGSMGVKLRPQRPGQSLDHELMALAKERKQIEDRWRKVQRDFEAQRESQGRLDAAERVYQRDMDAVDDKESRLYDAYDKLKNAGIGLD